MDSRKFSINFFNSDLKWVKIYRSKTDQQPVSLSVTQGSVASQLRRSPPPNPRATHTQTHTHTHTHTYLSCLAWQPTVSSPRYKNISGGLLKVLFYTFGQFAEYSAHLNSGSNSGNNSTHANEFSGFNKRTVKCKVRGRNVCTVCLGKLRYGEVFMYKS